MKNYAVSCERGPRHRSAFVADLPTCIATGATRGDTERRIAEAIAFHLDGMRANGEPIPEPTCKAGTVPVAS